MVFNAIKISYRESRGTPRESLSIYLSTYLPTYLPLDLDGRLIQQGYRTLLNRLHKEISLGLSKSSCVGLKDPHGA